MKIKRINLALSAFKERCELGKMAQLYYDCDTNELWCSDDFHYAEWIDITALIQTKPEWMASLYLYGMSRRLIEEVVKFIVKKGE